MKNPADQTRNSAPLSHAMVGQVLAWADAHHERTGKWPSRSSGAVINTPGETWSRISQALRRGHRGLTSGSSLAKLLTDKRGGLKGNRFSK